MEALAGKSDKVLLFFEKEKNSQAPKTPEKAGMATLNMIFFIEVFMVKLVFERICKNRAKMTKCHFFPIEENSEC